eukprot:GHRR01000947.1.p1 GENE.GHRR01000947.1~~GHRR01000947.1.p1  ORF type:complete len:394 (+),score=69.23 GHRR01000947.1:168-1349(+)
MRGGQRSHITFCIILGVATSSLQSSFVNGQDSGASEPISYGPGIANTGNATDANVIPNNAPEAILADGPTGDCAEPSRVNLSVSLAMSADIVVTGLVVAAGPAALVCAPANASLATLASLEKTNVPKTDLLVDYTGKETAGDNSTILLVSVQCVHKGALACRRNTVDAGGVVDSLGRCVVAVKVPPQSSSKNDKLPPCSISPGFRYTMLLNSAAVADCDGAYNIANAKVVDSIRPHLGFSQCMPYPTWPSQNTDVKGDGLASLISKTCPGAASAKRSKCTIDPCKEAECPLGAAITCVSKSCEGRYMMGGMATKTEACTAVFFSNYTGLPMQSCETTAQQLVRQARQAGKRMGLLTGQTSPTDYGLGPNGRPILVDPTKVFADRFGAANDTQP